MKVYELMAILADLPSGANVACAITLTTSELETGNQMGEDDYGEMMYSVSKQIDVVDDDKNEICLCC